MFLYASNQPQFCQKTELESLSALINFHDLVDAVVGGDFEIVLLGNGGRHEPEISSVTTKEKEG